MLMGLCEEPMRKRLSFLTNLFALSAVSEVYRNGIVLNNVDKLQNINGGVYGMLTDYNSSARLTSVKNFGLLGPFVSYKENEVL